MLSFAATVSSTHFDELADVAHAHTKSHSALSHSGAPSSPQWSSARPTFDRDKLYVEFAPLVKRLMRQYGVEPELRQDLAGEIYCRFCAFVDTYDPDRGIPLRPYLVRQLTASVYTYVRSLWTLQKREAYLSGTEAYNASADVYDPTDSWLAELSQQQILQALPRAIAQLSERQRKVVCWRYYGEISFEEIARLLEIKSATVRSLLRHGLANLRKQMHTADCGPAEF